ncbi:MAG: helix-turn-helix domain-containing protein [Gammaproteobacteria bacterium]|nr:helix-turn-helix domain-containing protein [Pseudomonadales bacterium]
MKNPIDFDKPRFGSKEAAAFLGVAEYTLRRSRTIGKLLGRPAPAYRKIGGKVLYERSTLSEWLDASPEQLHTAVA